MCRDESIGLSYANRLGLDRRHFGAVEVVDRSPGGQRVGAPERVVHRPWSDPAAVERREERLDFARC
jgi:hypothetical protein